MNIMDYKLIRTLIMIVQLSMIVGILIWVFHFVAPVEYRWLKQSDFKPLYKLYVSYFIFVVFAIGYYTNEFGFFAKIIKQ